MKKGWENKKLREVCDFDKVQGIHHGLPYVGLEHIESHTARFVGSSDPKQVKSATFRFSNQHVLYGRLRPYLNKALAPNFNGHCSTEIFPLKPHSELLRQYLLYWLLADETCDRINGTCTGARMPRAQMNEVLDFELLVPSLPEQQRIVRVLDEALAAIATAKANTEKNLQNAHAIFESHLNDVFTKRGDGWVEKTLEEVADDTCSLSYGIVQPGGDVTNGLPVVRPVDLTSKVVCVDGLKRIDPKLALGYRRSALQGGELLLCVRGSTGILSVASPELAGANVTRGIVPIRFRKGLLQIEFGYYLLKSAPVQEQIRAKTYGTALTQINIGDLRKLVVVIPALGIQKRLSGQLDELSQEAQHLAYSCERKLAALEELKKSLLHQAFNGEL